MVRRLSSDLALPAFFKDEVKEAEYAPPGRFGGTAQWFRLERRSWEALYETVREAVATERSIIIEGNFLARQRRVLRNIVPVDADVREILCRVSGTHALRRFVIRGEEQRRHPAHQDRLWYGPVALGALSAEVGLSWHRPLLLTGSCLIVDTTLVNERCYNLVLRYVSSGPAL